MRRAAFLLFAIVTAGCAPRSQPPRDAAPDLDAGPGPGSRSPGLRVTIAGQHTTRTRAAFTLRLTNGDDTPLDLGPDSIRLYDDHGRELRRLDGHALYLPPATTGTVEAEFDAPQAEGRHYQLVVAQADAFPVTIAERHHKPWFMCFPEFVLDVTRGLCSEIICGH